MNAQHYLVRWSKPLPAASANLEAKVMEAVRTVPVMATIEDLSLVMGEPSLAVEVTASLEEHAQLLSAWKSQGMDVEDLDREVRALVKPD